MGPHADRRDLPGPTEPDPLGRLAAPSAWPRSQEPQLNAKSLFLTAIVALVVVVAYEQSKGKIPTLKRAV